MPSSTTIREEHSDIQEPEKKARGGRGKPHLLTVLLSILLFIVTIHFLTVWQMPGTPAAQANCAALIRNTDYSQLVHLQAQSQEMQAIQYTSQLTNNQPSSLVQVAGTDAQHILDVYVYGCVIQKSGPKLTPWFTQRGLVEGTVEVSQANTLITSEKDTTLTTAASSLLEPLQQNVFREYSWHNGAFVQVTFPSLYPVTSRSEAELLQQQQNNGQSLPWNDPLATAQQMTKDMLKWPASDARDTVYSNDGTTAVVKLFQQKPRLEVTVTLKQLLPHNANMGLWFVVSAQTAGITLGRSNVSVQNATLQVTSPQVLQGTGAVPGGQTTVTFFDHTLSPLSLLSGATLNVDGSGAYTDTLLYTNSQPDQPGLLLIQSLPQDGSDAQGQLLLEGIIIG